MFGGESIVLRDSIGEVVVYCMCSFAIYVKVFLLMFV